MLRALLTAAAALLALGTVPVIADAAPLPPLSGATLSLPAPGKTDGTTVYKTRKKHKHKSSSSESATLDDFGSPKRGKQGVTITAHTAGSGRTCSLKLKYHGGGADSPDDVNSDGNGVCTFSMDISNDSSAVGDGTAELTVKKNGDKVASDSRGFTIKD